MEQRKLVLITDSNLLLLYVIMISSPLRSFTKAITYRVSGSLVTVGIAYMVFGKIEWAIGVGAIDAISKLLFYYIHERIWDKIKWGRRD